MKDRFRDWNLYHKSIVTVLVAMAFGIVLRALLVIDTAFEVVGEMEVPADAETVWHWVTSDEDRDKWQAELVDLVQLTGPTLESGATRLVFWQRGSRRWQAVERTGSVLPGRVVSLTQESDEDNRWITVTLDDVGDCRTMLRIEEIIVPVAYADRFWFFNHRSAHEKRLNSSFDALARWMATAAPECASDQARAITES